MLFLYLPQKLFTILDQLAIEQGIQIQCTGRSLKHILLCLVASRLAGLTDQEKSPGIVARLAPAPFATPTFHVIAVSPNQSFCGMCYSGPEGEAI